MNKLIPIAIAIAASIGLSTSAIPPEQPPAPAPPELHTFVLDLAPEDPAQLNTNTVVFIDYTLSIAPPIQWVPFTNVSATATSIVVQLPNQVAFWSGTESNKLGVGPRFFVEQQVLLPGNRRLSLHQPPKAP